MTDLRRHVPRVVLTWDDEVPGQRWREFDGTLMFADISGFTALTEKLSKRGRIGAEEIVETLNRVFGGMLDSAFARGGDLLKFGGDALLLLFRGDGHAERACDAVLEMKHALRDAASVPTSVGRLRLNMSVGIHSGRIHLFLVGEPTRELIVLGSAATLTADAEKSANAGEVVVSPGTAELLPASATRLRDDGALLLKRRQPAQPPSQAPALPTVDAARLGTLFPRELGEYLDPGAPEPEHRLATMGFIRVSGTDARLAADGPAAVADAMHVVVTRLEECLGAEGVTLLSTDLGSDGAGFFLGSGVPQSSEDDEGRMLRALRRFVDSDLPLPVQAGCNRGHVFAAEVGASTRAAYSAMGDTTNTAARIMSKATPGLLYAHPAVLEHSRTLFDTEPAGPFAMKGKAVPLLVYNVGEESGTREADAVGRLPLRGRDTELADVRAALDDALTGSGGVITVSGATGLGKSRLVREALSNRGEGTPEGITILTVRAEPYGQTSSYRVFRDPVRQLLGIARGTGDEMGEALLTSLSRVAPDLLPMAPLLADVAQVDVPSTAEADAIDPQYRPVRLAETLIDLVGRTFPGPLVLVAEEAHWTDRASAGLLERIAAATAGRPWVVIAVRRAIDSGFDPGHGTRVDLGPLPDDVIETLIHDATEAAPLRPHEVSAIVERAEGNPLFVEEAARVARTAGSLQDMPQTLQAALTAQIDLLDPVERRVLRTAAVLGRSFRSAILRETLTADGLTSDPGTMGPLGEFFERESSTRMRFRNSLVRDAAYEELAYRTRARLHRSAGLATESSSVDLEADSPTLSLHFSRAGDDERTWRYALMAGEQARGAYANADAAAQYSLALDAARHLDVPQAELVEAWTVLGELRELAGMFETSVTAYRRAADLLVEDPVARAEILVRRAKVHERAGAHRTGLRVLTQARRLLEPVSTPAADRTRARIDAVTAFIRLGQQRLKDARTSAMRAAEGARAAGDLATLEQALVSIDHAETFMGMPCEGEHTREALDICVRHGWKARESIARCNLGNFAFFAGRWEQAVEDYRLSRTAAMESGNAFGAAETDINLGEVLVNLGRVDEAEPVLRNAVRVLRASGVEFNASYAEMLLARVSLARGELQQALDEITPLVARFSEMGTKLTAFEAALVQAEVLIRAGEPEQALALIDEAEDAARGEVAPLRARLCLQRSAALLAVGRLAECTALIAEGLQLTREQELPYEEALLLRVSSDLALVEGRSADAGETKEEADRLLARLGVQGADRVAASS